MESKKDKNPDPQLVAQNSEVLGRTYNSQNPDIDKAAARADISAVDRQEGNMAHGETGMSNLGSNQPSQSTTNE